MNDHTTPASSPQDTSGAASTLLADEPAQEASAHVAAVARYTGARIGPLPDALLTLSEAILLEAENRIPGGMAHARLVSEAAAAAGAELGLPEDHVLLLSCAGLLHDIGCVQWPAQLLSKPGRWSNDDVTRAQRHPVSGEAMLLDVPALREAAPWIRQHHERADGSGYPDNLPASLLSEEGRLLAVIEVFAACIAARPFRGPLSPAETVARLQGEALAHSAPAPGAASVENAAVGERAPQIATGLDARCVEVVLSALQRAVPGQTLEKQTAWPTGGMAFDSPMLRRALSETFRAIADRLAEDYALHAGHDAGLSLRHALNNQFVACELPVRFTANGLMIEASDAMSAIDIAAMARRAMLLQAERMDALLSQPHAAQFRDTTYSCLSPWGQELAERYELFDGMALNYSGSQSTLFDGLSAYSPEAIAPDAGDAAADAAAAGDAADTHQDGSANHDL